MKRFSLRLPDELHSQLKIISIKNYKTLNEFITGVLEREIKIYNLENKEETV